MKLANGLALTLIWAATAFPQIPPDTFKTGHGEVLGGFYLGDQVDNERVAILLPEALSGAVIYSIRASFRPPIEGAVDPDTWSDSAEFTWGLSAGTTEQPQLATPLVATVPLKNYPDLRTGGWAAVQTEWLVPQEDRHWLVGYWSDKAKFVRLSQNQRQASCTIAIGYKQSGVESWQSWSNSGLEIEVAYGSPGQGVPSGVFDDAPSQESERVFVARANLSGSELRVIVPSFGDQTRIQVVNILGQTVVTHTEIAEFGEVRVPWGASHPSGVYFCRVQSGTDNYIVPFVAVK